MPKISVIIPVYRVEQYLDRCLSSVCDQTFTDLEIILVDDGSPDQCPQMCDEWSRRDKRIRVIHKENGGLSAARNTGLEMAEGEYINFVDSDDWMMPDALEHLLKLCERYDADLSMAGMERTDGGKIKISSEYEDRMLTKDEFLRRFFKAGTQENVQYAWGKLYKRKLFHDVRYPEGLTQEDVPTTFSIALQSERIAYSTKTVYCYYRNPSSITATFDVKRFDLLKAWDMVCETAQKDPSPWVREQARVCRDRADFGILCDLAMAELTADEKKKYMKMMTGVVERLRQNKNELLHADIPFSRKMLIRAFCVSYPAAGSLLGAAAKAARKAGWRQG